MKRGKKHLATKNRKRKPARKTQVKRASAPQARRAEGIRLFNLAGRPTKEQLIIVYGERGPRMTWEERAKAGVPAKKFQGALAYKVSHRKSDA